MFLSLSSVQDNSGNQCFIVLPTALNHILSCFQIEVYLSILLEFGLYSPAFDRKAGLLARRLDHGTVRSRGGTEPRWPRSSHHSPEPAYASVGRRLTQKEADREVKENYDMV